MITITSVSIHAEHESPHFGECSTQLTLEDEGGGMFIKITQCPDVLADSEVRLEFKEFEELYRAYRILVNQPTVSKFLT